MLAVNRILHPLDDLGHSNKVDVRVGGNCLVKPVEEGIVKFGIVFEPGSMVEETQRSSVLVIMSVEVVGEKLVELVTSQDRSTGVNHGTSRDSFLIAGILTTIKLVHDHLPDSKRPGGAVLQVSVAFMRHFEVEGVGPERRILKRSRNGGIIEEGLLLHHSKLIVATNPQVRGSQPDNRVISNVTKLLNNQPGASHLLSPVLNASLAPVCLVLTMSNGMGRNLMSKTLHVLDRGVVGVLVGHEECPLDGTSIGVLSACEKLVIKLDVVIVDGIVESDHHHLGNSSAVIVGGAKVLQRWTRNLGTVLGAETIGQLANCLVTFCRPIRVRLGI